MSDAKKTILVVGSTGKQGGAVISALLAAQPTNPFHILALTRSKESAKAKSLATKPNVSIVEGDLKDAAAIFQKAGPVWGVFSVLTPTPSSEVEEAHGKALIDAAVPAGVKHFVYSSVDRGGSAKSASNPTPIKHFISKHNTEKHLEAQAAASAQGMTYTILRPVAFMDNQTDDFIGKAYASMWQQIGSKQLQIVSTTDIGFFAAQAFLKPDEYRNRAISLAGDELNFDEAQKVFQNTVGSPMPRTFGFVASGLKWAMQEMLGTMFQWFTDEGYGADVAECRRINPEMQSYEDWLRKNSRFMKR